MFYAYVPITNQSRDRVPLVYHDQRIGELKIRIRLGKILDPEYAKSFSLGSK